MILWPIWISKDLITKAREEYKITLGGGGVQAVIKHFPNNKAHLSHNYTKDFDRASSKS